MGLLDWFKSSEEDNRPRHLKEAKKVWDDSVDALESEKNLLVNCVAVLADPKTPKMINDIREYMNGTVKPKKEKLEDFKELYPKIKEDADTISAKISEVQATLEHRLEYGKLDGNAQDLAEELLRSIQRFNDQQRERLASLRQDLNPTGDFDNQQDLLIRVAENFRLPREFISTPQKFYKAVQGNLEESNQLADELFDDEQNKNRR